MTRSGPLLTLVFRILSKFFSLGQVIETVRGGGVFQPAIDDAIKKLGQGEWVSNALVLHRAKLICLPEGTHLP